MDALEVGAMNMRLVPLRDALLVESCIFDTKPIARTLTHIASSCTPETALVDRSRRA
jgi:hypothetical protein